MVDRESLLPPAPTVDKNGEPLTPQVQRLVEQKRVRQETFLTHYRKTGLVAEACHESQIGESTFQAWMVRDMEFRLAVGLVRAQLADDLEGTSYNRARHGTKKEVYQNGQKVGEVTEYDFRREAFFLQHWKPSIYGPKLDIKVSSKTDDEVKTRLIEMLRQSGIDWDGEGEPPKIVDAELAEPSR